MSEMLILVAVAVVSVVIIHTVSSKKYRYDLGFRKGTKDCERARRTKYQTFYLERKEKGILTSYKMGYIDGYNCKINNK